MKSTIALSCIVAVVMVSSVQAGITYVDADLTNTTINGAAPVAGVNYSTAGSASDGLWYYRTRALNGGYIWETDAANSVTDAEATEPLVTTMTIADAGTYNIYGLMYINSNGAGNWDCSFSIGSDGPYTLFDKNSSNITNVSTTPEVFEGTVLVDDGGQDGILAYIGQVTTTVTNQQISVYVQGEAGTLGGDNRTWYDGVAYEPVPEPATMLLLSLGTVVVTRSRRK